MELELPKSKVVFESTTDGNFVLRGKYIPADKNRYNFMRLSSAIDTDIFKKHYTNEFAPRYNISRFKNEIVIIFDAAGLSQDEI